MKQVKTIVTKSIKTYLITLILGIVIVSISLVTVASLSMTYNALENSSLEQVQTATDVVNAIVKEISDNVVGITRSLANIDLIKEYENNASKIETYLKENEAIYTNIERIIVVDNNGQQIAQYPNTGNVNVKDREYYKKAMSGQGNFSEVIVSRSTGKQIVVYCEPIHKDGKVIGAIMSMINMDNYVNKITSVKTSDAINVQIVDPNGNQIIDTSTYFDEKTVEEQQEVISLIDFGPTKEVIAKNSGDKEFSYEGREYFSSYAYIPEIEWGVIITISIADALGAIYTTIFMILGITLLIIIMVSVFSVILTSRITKPIAHITEKFKALANGEFGTEEVDASFLNREDEFGELARAAHVLNNNIVDIVSNIKDNSKLLITYANKINMLVGDNNDKLVNTSGTVESLREESENNLKMADASIKTLEEISEGVNEIAINIQEVLEMVNTSTKSSEVGVIQMKDTVQALEIATENGVNIESKMTELQKLSEEISSFGETILNISQQTNLLALNAAIESARAGEAGKGFAVVADEVRKLADSSSYAAERITKLVSNATSKITTTSELVKNMGSELYIIKGDATARMQEMQDVMDKSQSALLAIESITAVAEEQTACAEETTSSMQIILESMKNTTGISEEVSQNTKEQTKSLESLKEMANKLNEMSSQLEVTLDFFK